LRIETGLRGSDTGLPAFNPFPGKPVTQPTPSKLMAALWMAGWLSQMLVMAVAGRETTREMNVFELMELRSIIAFFLLLPFLYRDGGFAAIRTTRLPSHIARNLVHYVAQLGWFFALTLIPIAQVVALEFTMPVWTAILAASFLGERITAWKAAAIVLGIVGVIAIVRPATGEVNPGQLMALAAAVGFGISMVLVKSLTRTESALAIIFWMTVIQGVTGFLPTLYVWTWPSAYVWFWVSVIGVCGTFSHYCLASAMRYADATIVVPMDFLRVPLTATVGWLLYAERLDAYTVLGAALILAGNLLNLKPNAPVPARAGT
jgi:drug/metabolite transporter (DMT)-like permease